MNLIQVNQYSFEDIKLNIDESLNIIEYNNVTYNCNKFINENKQIYISDMYELSNNTFTKLELILDKSNNLLDKSYLINGNIINQTVYCEEDKNPLIVCKNFNELNEKFIKLFTNSELLCNMLYNLPTMDLTSLLNISPTIEFNIKRELIDFNNKTYAIKAGLDILHLLTLDYLIPEQYIIDNSDRSNIVIEYGENYNIEFNNNNKIRLTIRNNLYDGMYDLYNSIKVLKDLINEYNIESYFDNAVMDKLTELEYKNENDIDEGCNKGGCGKSNCCQNKEPEQKQSSCCQNKEPQLENVEKQSSCCQNKADSECCKKNTEVKCDSTTCANYESCCGSNKEKETIDMYMRKFFKNKDALGFILFMKGDKEMPKCKFSRATVEKLNAINLTYTTNNILDNQELRDKLKEHHPTYPQLYYNYTFVCGGDKINDTVDKELETFLSTYTEKKEL